MFELEARLGARGFDVSVTVGSGETVAILGPNGAGKSTLLNVIAGLLKPDSGHARLDDKTLFSLAAGTKSVWMPPHLRGVSLLAQQALLFPHLSVLDNVAFGPTSAGVAKGVARRDAEAWLREVEASDFAGRKPGQLSGGQAQRIAVARALASHPRLLLLDEPMAALDVTVTPTLRRMLRRVLERRTVILVTHDVIDAFTLADRVVVMNEGRVIDNGPTRDVLERPRNAFTAALVALNLLTGVRTATGLVTSGGVGVSITSDADIPNGANVGATVEPSAVSVSMEKPSAFGLNVFEGIVSDLEPRGDLIRVHMDHLSADVSPALIAHLDVVPGSRAWFAFHPSTVTLYRL